MCVKKNAQDYLLLQARFDKLDFLFRPNMKYFQLNVNLLLYRHKTTPFTYFFSSSLKTLKTLYLTSQKLFSIKGGGSQYFFKKIYTVYYTQYVTITTKFA